MTNLFLRTFPVTPFSATCDQQSACAAKPALAGSHSLACDDPLYPGHSKGPSLLLASYPFPSGVNLVVCVNQEMQGAMSVKRYPQDLSDLM